VLRASTSSAGRFRMSEMLAIWNAFVRRDVVVVVFILVWAFEFLSGLG